MRAHNGRLTYLPVSSFLTGSMYLAIQPNKIPPVIATMMIEVIPILPLWETFIACGEIQSISPNIKVKMAKNMIPLSSAISFNEVCVWDCSVGSGCNRAWARCVGVPNRPRAVWPVFWPSCSALSVSSSMAGFLAGSAPCASSCLFNWNINSSFLRVSPCLPKARAVSWRWSLAYSFCRWPAAALRGCCSFDSAKMFFLSI